MKVIETPHIVVTYESEKFPSVTATNPRLAPAIAWADKYPVVWEIVTNKRSKAFGLGSCEYIGCAQKSNEPGAVLERVRHLHDIVTGMRPGNDPVSIFVWRARFTIRHYRDKGFTGGFFQQHDAKYPRSCLTLDYTPETHREVLDKFCDWMDKYHDTRRITIDGTTVRTYAGKEAPCLMTNIVTQ